MKRKLLGILGVAIVSFNALGATVFAKPISFSIKKADGSVFVTNNKKELGGSQWQISNFDTLYSNFIQDRDVVGFRTKSSDNISNYSNYHTFSKFVYRYSLPYITTPAMNTTLRLNTQIDSSSAFSVVKFEGEWVS